MRFEETPVPGVFVIEPAAERDERGFFARTFARADFEARGLSGMIEECSVSYNERPGTLRGLHLQMPPFAECKLVRCSRGAIFDVAVDLRQGSATLGEWVGVELSEDNLRMLYVPEGCAHGFQTLESATEVVYQISTAYRPDAARGVRWDDPAIGIEWPAAESRVISQRDAQLPLMKDFAL